MTITKYYRKRHLKSRLGDLAQHQINGNFKYNCQQKRMILIWKLKLCYKELNKLTEIVKREGNVIIMGC